VEFASAVKDALRDVHSPDLLALNPLLRDGICNLGGSTGPQELKALLCETVRALFGNARDEKLRRILELTYSQPFLKQEAVADRLALSFGTYRRHLGNARDRLARWLWESSLGASIQPELPSASEPTEVQKPEGEAALLPEADSQALPRLSIAVLPFLNIGGNAEDDSFVDGITETLTTDLSRCSGVFAISRNTAFAYKGKPIDTRQIGRELGVRYVLEGSVQNAGERFRFNAQLVDAESGAHLWAERFDKQRGDPLDMQDKVTARLARTIHMELIAAESRRTVREHPDRLDSVDHTFRGWAAWNRHLSLEAAREARRFFEAALQLDPDNFAALLGFANATMSEVNMCASSDRAGQIRAAEAAASKALALAPDSADAHVTHRTVLFGKRAPDRALREFNVAIGLDGNLAPAHAYAGVMKLLLGRRTRLAPMSRKRCGSVRAIRSSSNGIFLSVSPMSISGEWFTASRACARWSRSIRTGDIPISSWPARSALPGCLRRRPKCAPSPGVSRPISRSPSSAPKRGVTIRRSSHSASISFFEGLRLAGVPEG